MKRILALILVLAICFSGCQSKTYQSIIIDLKEDVINLDPQFATDASSCFVIFNTYRGLVWQDKNGDIVPEIASEYSISSDQKTYTFTLRKGVEWSDGNEITAEDFAFAFTRIFDPVTPSPYAGSYSDIKNSSQIVAGTMPMENLGVRVVSKYVLEIELEQPNSQFLKLLTQTAAMPCQPAFFKETMARYGKDVAHAVFNGPFEPTYWNNEVYVRLVKNDNYFNKSDVNTPYVYIFTGRGYNENKIWQGSTMLDYFVKGNTDIYEAGQSEISNLENNGYETYQVNNIVWGLTANINNPILGNEKIRRALFMVLDQNEFINYVNEQYHIASSFMPDVESTLPTYNQARIDEAVALFKEGLAEMEVESIEGLTVIFPKSGNFDSLTSYMIRQWKDYFITYINFEAMEDAEYLKMVEQKNFAMAIVQLEYDGTGLESIYSGFTTGDWSNYYNFSNEEFDSIVSYASGDILEKEKVSNLQMADKILYDKGVAVPLVGSNSYYAFGKGIEPVEKIGLYFNIVDIYKEEI